MDGCIQLAQAVHDATWAFAVAKRDKAEAMERAARVRAAREEIEAAKAQANPVTEPKRLAFDPVPAPSLLR